jgi:hypothetical protein
LLSKRVARPRARRASEYRDEFPPPHSITSSATASSAVARCAALRRLERWATRLTENDSYPFDDLITTNELSDFRHPCPVKLLNRSLPREASGDDPRGRRVGMISTTALGRIEPFAWASRSTGLGGKAGIRAGL